MNKWQDLLHKMKDKPAIMAVLNVTPDSFSDGGKFINKNKAVERCHQMVTEGADIIDIGGESTRPGSQVIDYNEEIDRIIPVIEAIKSFAPLISVDTRNSQTMRQALTAGATIVNDISALTYDSEAIKVVAEYQCPTVLMHMQGTPQTMQKNPQYQDVTKDVLHFLNQKIHECETYGIDKTLLIIDPGIGFGKTLNDNCLLLSNIREFQALGCLILLGTSRKSFIGQISGEEKADRRLPGSISSLIWGRSQGVQMFRVHDVQETKQALDVYEAIASASASS